MKSSDAKLIDLTLTQSRLQNAKKNDAVDHGMYKINSLPTAPHMPVEEPVNLGERFTRRFYRYASGTRPPMPPPSPERGPPYMHERPPESIYNRMRVVYNPSAYEDPFSYQYNGHDGHHY